MNRKQKEVLQAQLNREKQTIAELKLIYEQAAKDVENRIRELSMRTDMENLQTIIYQKQYQEVLKKQIDNVLDSLHTQEFATIESFLTNCYTDGYLGVMYDIAGQGIPIIMPIDPKQVVKALQTDSKISTKLYTRLGEDVKKLKSNIRMELSRGITQGASYNQIAVKIAKGMKSDHNTAYNSAVRIARTEGHRIQCQSAYDAQKAAVSKGAEVVKQWNSVLDGRTRPHHRQLDGQIRELDEPFEIGTLTADYPGAFGRASEDCNCRCALLQRARWALDDDELETLKERAAFHDLDKAKDFEDFQKKYLKAVESENFSQYTESEKISKNIKYAVDSKMIESRAYIDKFKSMTDDADVQKEYYQAAKDILKHRSGQNGEDLYLYNTNKKKWYKSTTGKEAGTPEYTQDILDGIAQAGFGELVSFHNHPASMPPSADDINSALKNGYSKGYAFCHDGKIFEYTASDRLIDPIIYDLRIAKYQKNGYTEYEAQIKTMEYLSEIYGFTFREVK